METHFMLKLMGSMTSGSTWKFKVNIKVKSPKNSYWRVSHFRSKHERKVVQHHIYSKQIKQWSESTKENEEQSDEENE